LINYDLNISWHSSTTSLLNFFPFPQIFLSRPLFLSFSFIVFSGYLLPFLSLILFNIKKYANLLDISESIKAKFILK